MDDFLRDKDYDAILVDGKWYICEDDVRNMLKEVHHPDFAGGHIEAHENCIDILKDIHEITSLIQVRKSRIDTVSKVAPEGVVARLLQRMIDNDVAQMLELLDRYEDEMMRLR